MDKFLAGIGTLMLSFVFVAFMLVLRAAVTIDLWTWFVSPTFNLAAPDMPVAIGLLVLCSLVQGSKPKVDEDKTIQYANAVLLPLFAWGIGWIASTFI